MPLIIFLVAVAGAWMLYQFINWVANNPAFWAGLFVGAAIVGFAAYKWFRREQEPETEEPEQPESTKRKPANESDKDLQSGLLNMRFTHPEIRRAISFVNKTADDKSLNDKFKVAINYLGKETGK